MTTRAPRELSDRRPAAEVGIAQPQVEGVQAAVRERARRRLVTTVLLIYLLAIFEGSIRKYVVPQFGQYVFFVRDPLLIYAYLLATRHGLWPRHGWFQLSVLMGLLGLPLFALQAAMAGLDNIRMLLGIYGWRGYFLYVPLAFLVGAQFRRADLMRFAKWTLALSIPIAVLVAVQFGSPQNAVVNVGIAAEQEYQFKGIGLDGERIRPTGPFTSSSGQTQFTATACAFVLALLLMAPAGRGIGLIPLLVAAAAVLSCVALGGSRGTMLLCGVIGAYAVLLGLVGRGAALKARAVALPLALAGVAVLLYPIVFPEGFEAFVTRWDTAAKAERGLSGGVFGRALLGLVDFIRLIELVPPLGFGLGYGGNASITLQAKVDGVLVGYFAETDFARHMVDIGPALGLLYITFRVALVVWLGRLVLRASRVAADPMPMMMYAFASYNILLGQMTGHGTINVYGWLFTGLCIAACHEALRGTAQTAVQGSSTTPERAVRSGHRPAAWPMLSRQQPSTERSMLGSR